MSDRLISADVLKSSILQWQFKIGQDGIWYVLGLIDSTPTVEAEPIKHGEWLIDKSGSLMCSKCGTLLDEGQKPSRYCPNCGARCDL